MGELLEMRYLWRTSVKMESSRLTGFLGDEPHTPLDEAIERSMEGLRCLPERGRSGVGSLVG
jgi:nucleoside-diphosphate-sugar epimerase